MEEHPKRGRPKGSANKRGRKSVARGDMVAEG